MIDMSNEERNKFLFGIWKDSTLGVNVWSKVRLKYGLSPSQPLLTEGAVYNVKEVDDDCWRIKIVNDEGVEVWKSMCAFERVQ